MTAKLGCCKLTASFVGTTKPVLSQGNYRKESRNAALLRCIFPQSSRILAWWFKITLTGEPYRVLEVRAVLGKSQLKFAAFDLECLNILDEFKRRRVRKTCSGDIVLERKLLC